MEFLKYSHSRRPPVPCPEQVVIESGGSLFAYEGVRRKRDTTGSDNTRWRDELTSSRHAPRKGETASSPDTGLTGEPTDPQRFSNHLFCTSDIESTVNQNKKSELDWPKRCVIVQDFCYFDYHIFKSLNTRNYDTLTAAVSYVTLIRIYAYVRLRTTGRLPGSISKFSTC